MEVKRNKTPKDRSSGNLQSYEKCLVSAISAAKIAIDQKALDVKLLDIREVASFSDVFTIVSGTSDRHVKGIVDKIIEGISAEHQQKPIAVCGYDHGEWVLIDYVDLVVHVFHEQARQFYDLDGLWKDAHLIALPESIEGNARMFRTGMYR